MREADLWWTQTRLKEYRPLLPINLLEVVTRAYAIVEVGGLSGVGAERGRNFEQLFYNICKRRGVYLSEKAGSQSLAGQRSASGFRHEVDAATKALPCITHWELKHLTGTVPKNELLIFNGKGLDFLQGTRSYLAKKPLLRFLLSGTNLRDESRHYGALWGIMIIEPDRLPLPLIYEAVARGASAILNVSDCIAVKDKVTWACRSLQTVICELADWSVGAVEKSPYRQPVSTRAREIIDIQEQIGKNVMDYLDDEFPEWVDRLAEDTWKEVGGW